MNLSESYKKRLQELANINWSPEYLYHFTPSKNVKSIMKNGLVPKHSPNREYLEGEFTSNAVYLTNLPMPSTANLPRDLDYEKLTILKINTSYLNKELFVVDDDYYDIYMAEDDSIESMGDEIRKPERLKDSLEKETGVAYEGTIPSQAISIYKPNFIKESLDTQFPIVAYHGTNKDFDKFDISFANTTSDPGDYGEGIYFDTDKEWAASYSHKDVGFIITAKLHLTSPFIINFNSYSEFNRKKSAGDMDNFSVPPEINRYIESLNLGGANIDVHSLLDYTKGNLTFLGISRKLGSKNITKYLTAAGYDGVVVNYGENSEIVVFDTSKIKITNKEKTKEFYSQKFLTENKKELTENINSKYAKDVLYGLKQHAKHFKNYQDFETFYSIKGNHGIYYHITNNPNFKISQQIGLRDMSSMTSGKVSEKGALMVTSDLEYWDSHYNNYTPDDSEHIEDIKRSYVAIIDLSEIEPLQINPTQRGFGHEIYLKPDVAKKARVIKVLNIKDTRNFDNYFNKIKPNSTRELKKLWTSAHKNQNLSENNLPNMQSMLPKYKLRYPQDNALIIVNIDKLLARHKMDEPEYAFSTRETSDYPGRVERAKKYWVDYAEDSRPIFPKDGTRKDWGNMAFEAPYISIWEGKLEFSDGRHRVIAMKELGYKNIIIEIPKDQIRLFDSFK